MQLKFHWESEHPWENTTDGMHNNWKLPLTNQWEMPPEIHNDFLGVDFWFLVYNLLPLRKASKPQAEMVQCGEWVRRSGPSLAKRSPISFRLFRVPPRSFAAPLNKPIIQTIRKQQETNKHN